MPEEHILASPPALDPIADAFETPEERKQKRFARRWKRRARVLGPFLGIPLVFGAMALSMDFVSHLPAAQMATAQARATQTRPLAKSIRPTGQFARTPSASRSPKRASAGIRGGAQQNAASIDALDVNSLSLEIPDAHTATVDVPGSPFREGSIR